MAMFVMHFYFDFTMYQFGRVLIIYATIITATGAASIKSETKATSTNQNSIPNTTTELTTKPDNVVGVVSTAVVASRNGRLSSMNGIKFFPPIDKSMITTDNKGTIIVKDINGKMPMPITITKEGDGVLGTIHILPGSVSVTSSTNSGSTSDFKPWAARIMPPRMTDIFIPPFPVFNSRIPEPWIPKDMFKQSLPHPDMLRPGWIYPSFSPFFNFW